MKLSPGVVTGEDYRTLVASAKAGGYALPAVNVTSSSVVNAVLEAAAKNKSDIIIQISNAGGRFFAGAGLADPFKASVLGAVAMAQHVHLLALQYGICVALHTDHANRALLPWVDALIHHSEGYHAATQKTLFSSHMIDLSEEPLSENLTTCAAYLSRLAKIDMSLEIELGVTGGEEDGVGRDDVHNARLYTQADDVLAAYDMLSPLGHFSVAASFGNVHGVYAPGHVHLRPEILKESQSMVAATRHTGPGPMNFVFHGGSGSAIEDIRAAVSYGVFKMNIDTDMQFAYAAPVAAYMAAHAAAFRSQIDPTTGAPFKKEYDPRTWMRLGEQGMVARLTQAFTDLGSTGRSLAG